MGLTLQMYLHLGNLIYMQKPSAYVSAVAIGKVPSSEPCLRACARMQGHGTPQVA